MDVCRAVDAQQTVNEGFQLQSRVLRRLLLLGRLQAVDAITASSDPLAVPHQVLVLGPLRSDVSVIRGWTSVCFQGETGPNKNLRTK